MTTLRDFLQQRITKTYFWAAELLYHGFAWAYDGVAWLVSFGFWSQWRLDSLQYLKPGPVLETGFGTGSLLIEMNKRGLDVIGLELSPHMHRVAGRKIKRNHLAVRRVRGSTEAMPFPDRSFSNVLSAFPSNYVFSKQTCNEVRRVLDEAGRWVIVGLGMQFKSGIKQKLTRWVWGNFDQDFIRQISEKMESGGFSSSIIFHETAQYTIPILILTCEDA